MYIKNRAVSLVYKILLILLCGYGLFLNSGLLEGQLKPGMLKYYTILSNLLCFIYYIVAALHTGREIGKSGLRGPSSYAIRFKGAVILGITVTLLIYQFILADTPFSMGAGDGQLKNHVVHLFVPLLVIFDWLLFDKKGCWRIADPFLWLVFPALYFIYALVAAPLGMTYFGGNRYPYGFINVDTLGWGGVLTNVLFLALGFLALGFAVLGLDKLLAKLFQKKQLKK